MRGLVIRDDRNASELRRFAAAAADRRAALRALAIASALEGSSRTDAARVIGRERQSLRDSVVRYNAEGLDGLKDRLGRGAQEKLSNEQKAELKTWVVEGPEPERDGVSTYRLVDIAGHIETKWGVPYTLSAVSKLLRRMGLSWQKARPSHPQGNAEAQADFKKTLPCNCRT